MRNQLPSGRQGARPFVFFFFNKNDSQKKKKQWINDAGSVLMMREADKSIIQKYKNNDQHLYL